MDQRYTTGSTTSGSPASWHVRAAASTEGVLADRRGLVVDPVRQEQLAGVGAAPAGMVGREVGEQGGRPTVLDHLVALRLEGHDQADRRRHHARIERFAAEFLVQHDRRGRRGERPGQPDLEGAHRGVREADQAPPLEDGSEAVAMIERDAGHDAPIAGQSEQPQAALLDRHVCTSGRRGSGTIDGHSVRTQARSGSSVLAMVRRSPASAFR